MGGGLLLRLRATVLTECRRTMMILITVSLNIYAFENDAIREGNNVFIFKDTISKLFFEIT